MAIAINRRDLLKSSTLLVIPSVPPIFLPKEREKGKFLKFSPSTYWLFDSSRNLPIFGIDIFAFYQNGTQLYNAEYPGGLQNVNGMDFFDSKKVDIQFGVNCNPKLDKDEFLNVLISRELGFTYICPMKKGEFQWI